MSTRKSAPSPGGEKMLTLAGGGWVLVLAGIFLVALLVWALWGPITRTFTRPPGDGRNPETYGFELDNFALRRDLLEAALLHRDLVESIDTPGLQTVAQIEAERKHVVSTDRVIGVTVGGETRAYPLNVLNVHEIVNDRVGGEPILVTYSLWCDTPMVYRRPADRTFGSSGLVWNGNTLLYDRAEPGEESLWLQVTGEAVSGSRLGESLEPIPFEFVSWERWSTLHPETTVLGREPSYADKRYQKGDPAEYFRSTELIFTVDPLVPEITAAMAPGRKTRVVVIEIGGERLVYPHGLLERQVDDEGSWTRRHGAVTLTFEYDIESHTVHVDVDPPETPMMVQHALWFAWHAIHPEDELVDSP